MIKMNKKIDNILRPVGTRFKIIREPFPYSTERYKRCNEWEVVNHIQVFGSEFDKVGMLAEEIKMISSKIIK